MIKRKFSPNDPSSSVSHRLDVEPKKMSTLKKTSIALAGIGLAGAGFLGVKVMGGEDPTTEPRVEPIATAPANLDKHSNVASPEVTPSEAKPATSNESTPQTSTPKKIEKSSVTEKSLENLAKKATTEQIQWVLDHPVRASEYVTAEEQIEAIGLRRNVIINSGVTDPNEFNKLVKTIYDEKSGGYDGFYTELAGLTEKTAKILEDGRDIFSPITAVEFSGVVEGDTSTVKTIVDRISPSDPSYIEGPALRVTFTMHTDSDGIVRVYDYMWQEG